LENSRNPAVATTQTVWLPRSAGPVSQQPLRKNPVIGLVEQVSSRSPSTLRDGLRPLPPPSLLPSSNGMTVSPRASLPGGNTPACRLGNAVVPLAQDWWQSSQGRMPPRQ